MKSDIITLIERSALIHALLKSIRIITVAFSSLNTAHPGKLAANLMRSLSLKSLFRGTKEHQAGCVPVDKILVSDWTNFTSAKETSQVKITQVFPDYRDVAIRVVV